MKKAVLIFMIFSLVVFPGCRQTYDIKDNTLNRENQPDSAEYSEVASTQSTEDVLNQLASQEFFIPGEKLSDADEETITAFGKAFVNLYNGAVGDQKKVSFEKYISNKNLREFTDKMLELTQKRKLQGGSAVNYGLKNEFGQAEIQQIQDNLYYIEIPFQFEGSGQTCKILITVEDKSLKLADLYFGTKDGVDTSATGHPAEREINNPDLWEDEAWVKGVFDRLEGIEKSLGS
ncbi:hypothetical protein [Geosporobacter ferrireducens]|uniref:hypothetical protein n=1 Tax=Geosporobacter ferrireducens TaxID=1424294 RepID=UPI00139DCD64|nr:hypothetical protein [Geosporobacter ferrireducens]MTI56104.1 hypothetical protein [Geosporobacter ferrireducens]